MKSVEEITNIIASSIEFSEIVDKESGYISIIARLPLYSSVRLSTKLPYETIEYSKEELIKNIARDIHNLVESEQDAMKRREIIYDAIRMLQWNPYWKSTLPEEKTLIDKLEDLMK